MESVSQSKIHFDMRAWETVYRIKKSIRNIKNRLYSNQLINKLISPLLSAYTYCERCIGQNHTLFSFRGNSSIELDVAKKILKLHRNAPPFEGKDADARLRGFADSDVIFNASSENNIQLRKIYQELFGSKRARAEMTDRLNSFFDNVTFSPANQPLSLSRRMLHALNFVYFANQSVIQPIKTLTSRIAIEVLFDVKLAEHDFIRIEQILKHKPSNIKKIATDLRGVLQESSIWSKMENLGYSENQQLSSIFLLMNVTAINVSQGLKGLIKNCFRDPLILTTLKSDLENPGLPPEKRPVFVRTVTESLRVSPVVSIIDRNVATAGFNLSSFGGSDNFLKGKSRVLINLASYARDPAIVGKNPEQFCPHRMTVLEDTSAKEGYLPSHPAMPFGHGKNMCPAWWWYSAIASRMLAKMAVQYG